MMFLYIIKHREQNSLKSDITVNYMYLCFFFLPDKTQYSFPLLSPSQVIESIHDLNMLVDLPGLEEKDFKQPTVSK